MCDFYTRTTAGQSAHGLLRRNCSRAAPCLPWAGRDMKAVIYDRLGSAQVLRIADTELASLRPGEVRVLRLRG
jgi:hypothetical protein